MTKEINAHHGQETCKHEYYLYVVPYVICSDHRKWSKVPFDETISVKELSSFKIVSLN